MIATTSQQRFAASTPPDPPPPSAAGQEPIPALARVPVIVIEDEAMIAWMLESLLEDMGFEAITLASDAMEAAAAAKRQAPGLVISDVNLGPGADGIEAVRAIRRMCSPAVVFVSAYIDEDARSRISEGIADAPHPGEAAERPGPGRRHPGRAGPAPRELTTSGLGLLGGCAPARPGLMAMALRFRSNYFADWPIGYLIPSWSR